MLLPLFLTCILGSIGRESPIPWGRFISGTSAFVSLLGGGRGGAS